MARARTDLASTPRPYALEASSEGLSNPKLVLPIPVSTTTAAAPAAKGDNAASTERARPPAARAAAMAKVHMPAATRWAPNDTVARNGSGDEAAWPEAASAPTAPSAAHR